MPISHKPLKILILILGVLILIQLACGQGVNPPSGEGIFSPSPELPSKPPPSPTTTQSPSPTQTQTPSSSPTSTLPSTATSSSTPSTPTESPTPTITLTYAILRGKVIPDRANCRYGPGWMYLYKYGLVGGSNLEIIGRTDLGDWVLIQAIGGDNPCWVRADLMEIKEDVLSVAPVDAHIILPWSP